MPENHQQRPENTVGDLVKNKVDDGMAGAMRKVWKSVREVGAGSFFKGALLSGIVVMGVMALVGGFMGSSSSLEVAGQGVMNTFEKGAGAGLSKAFEFLTHGLGLATMGIFGTMATASTIISSQQKQAALESERLALEYQRSRTPEKQQSTEKETATSTVKETHSHTKQEPVPAKPKEENGIYVKGSVIKTEKFCAAELKRRTERETHVENIGV